MTKTQIDKQYQRISRAIVNAWNDFNDGDITAKQRDTKLILAEKVRQTMVLAEHRLQERGY